MSGAVSFHAGLAAEAIVARHYARGGARLREMRWRGDGGEIDLVLEDGAALVFVEVKKGRDFAHAARRIGAAQQARLQQAAGAYLSGCPAGLDTECRFDVALVDGAGRVEILRNAFM